MHLNINEFLDEQKKGLGEMVENFRKTRVAAARNAARESAARIKSLNERVRSLARSGLRLTAVTHGATQSLIELQADIVSSALGDAAAQIERMAYTESVKDLARMQAEVLQGARERIVADFARTVNVLKDAAGDARKAVAPRAPAKSAARKGAAVRRKKKAPVRRAKAPVRRAKAPVRRAKAPVRRKATVAARGKAPAKRARRKSPRR